ncbi:MAG: hypothetical protein IPN69_07980 [Acidobacteria bacterium]|nr:hypothetical protein [Acidobacteriota bacterium]
MAVVNNNDLSEGVKRVLDDQRYYLIGYQPDDDTFDKQKRKFNKLDVRVKRPGVKVRYRSGFINVAGEETPKATTAETPVQAIQKALVSPFAVMTFRSGSTRSLASTKRGHMSVHCCT